MKKTMILLPLLSLHLAGLAQFSLYVFPMGASGDPFADTLLNTNAILKKEGIKKINADVQSSLPGGSYTSKTLYLNSNGNVDSMKLYFQTGIHRDSGFLIDYLVLYDDKGRMTELTETDAKANTRPLFTAQYISDKKVKYSSIGKFNNSQNVDTLIDYKYYNDKQQMIKLEQIRNPGVVSSTMFYYNNDGLFDSIKYENSPWGTFVFKRSGHRKNKVIEMENSFASYVWRYNVAAQCLSTTYYIKRQPASLPASGARYSSKTEIIYYYNPDGTLSKVTEQTNNRPATTLIYSYTK